MNRMKRLMDLALVVASAPLSIPLMVGVAIMIRIKLGTPVLFRQQRPGIGGQPFQLLKFRTMTDAKDDEGRQLSDSARLTPFGRRLRASSLDELPELWNVLKGEMSLIGPRPLLMQYLPRYTSEQARRHEVTPGLTGWAQIHGRNDTTWEARLALDVWYVDHRSLRLDLRILVATLSRVLRREGIQAVGTDTMPEFIGTSATIRPDTPGKDIAETASRNI